MAVEQNSNLLNELANDWFEVEGDAEHAWQVIARCIDEGRSFPAWVLPHIRRVADDPPLPREPKEKPTKAYYDPIEVFSIVAAWRQAEKVSLQSCFERYINEQLGGNGEEETLKTAYYRGLRMAWNEIALMQAVTGSETTTSLEKTAWAGLAGLDDP